MAQSHSTLGLLLQQLGQTEHAYQAYREALRLDPELTSARANLATLLQYDGKLDDAITEFRAGQAISAHGRASLQPGECPLAEERVARRWRSSRKPCGSIRSISMLWLPWVASSAIWASLTKASRLACRDGAETGSSPRLEEPGRGPGKKAGSRRAARACEGEARLEGGAAHIGKVLHDLGRFEEAIKPLEKAVALDPKDEWALRTLGASLSRLGRNDEAIATLRRALEITPQDATAHMNLGSALYQKPDLEAAIAAFNESLRLKPDDALARKPRLRTARQGRRDGAIDKIEQAARFDPTNADHRYWLGSFLDDRNRYHEAALAYREAVKLRPDYFRARSGQSVALFQDGQVEEATRTARETARLYPKEAFAHYDLGTMLMHGAQTDAAIESFREAPRLDPNLAEAHCNLGQALEQKGQFAEALDFFRRGHEAGTKRGNWTYPSQWVADCEHLLAMEKLLKAVLDGTKQPKNSEEQIELARVANLVGLYAESVKMCAEALAKEPAAADPGKSPIRYQAASCAAVAGAGEGQEKQAIDEKDKANWRAQAIEWLKADLGYWKKQVGTGTADSLAIIRQTLEHWKTDANLTGIRDEQALEARLPEAERKAFREFWDDVNGVLGKVLARE